VRAGRTAIWRGRRNTTDEKETEEKEAADAEGVQAPARNSGIVRGYGGSPKNTPILPNMAFFPLLRASQDYALHLREPKLRTLREADARNEKRLDLRGLRFETLPELLPGEAKARSLPARLTSAIPTSKSEGKAY